jgi:hypothetical protein
MGIPVDTLITALEEQASAYNQTAYGYTVTAAASVLGNAGSIPTRTGWYAQANGQRLADIPPVTITPADVVSDVQAALQRYFNQFFPSVSTQYNIWLAEIADAVTSGVPLTLDNETANRQAQSFGEAEGIRARRKLRSGFAGRGYSMPPGVMVGMVLDESDARTEQLITGAIGNANKATDQVIATYKTVLATAISTSDARVAAVRAMTDLILAAANVYSTEIDAQVAVMRAQEAATKAVLAYHDAEIRLDSANTNLYRQNSQLVVRRFEQEGQLFYMREAAQIEAAIAGAVEAGKIAQAAYSSLNTIVSASTAGFG